MSKKLECTHLKRLTRVQGSNWIAQVQKSKDDQIVYNVRCIIGQGENGKPSLKQFTFTAKEKKTLDLSLNLSLQIVRIVDAWISKKS